MTAGWDLLICWKDQLESWAKLSDLKESHLVETAEFAKVQGIDDEPVFTWWTPYVLKSAMPSLCQSSTASGRPHTNMVLRFLPVWSTQWNLTEPTIIPCGGMR